MSHVSSWIAARYFFSRTKTRFLPFLTVVAIGGVAIGTCAMVVILSVMHGFTKELEKRLLGFNAHVTVTQTIGSANLTADELRTVLDHIDVVDIVPFVEGEVIVEAAVGEELFAQGARLKGLDPRALGRMTDVGYYFPPGEGMATALARLGHTPGLPGIIVGRDILGQLNVHPDFFDRIEVIAPLADVGPTGELEPRLERFVLRGSFTSGVYEYDTHFVLVGIDEAMKVLGVQASEGWQVRLHNPHAAPAAVSVLKQVLGSAWVVEGWYERNRKLFAALKLERIAMGGVTTLVVLIASFSVIGVIMMVVSSKRKDIALLKAMGMRERSVRGVFLRQGMWIGVVGAGIGCLIGTLVCAALMRWPIRLPQSYYVDTLAVSLRPAWIVTVALVGVVLAMASSIYPVRKATGEEPILALRYE